MEPKIFSTVTFFTHMTVAVHAWTQILETSLEVQIIAFFISQIQICWSVFPGRNDSVTLKSSNRLLQPSR